MWLGEGKVEQRKFLLATDESFRLCAVGERKLVEVNVVGWQRLLRLWQFGKGGAAKFLGNVGGEFAKDAVLRSCRQSRERIRLVRCLSLRQPCMDLPIALFADHWKHQHFAGPLKFTEDWEFHFEDVVGLERLLGEQHNRKSRGSHGLLDVVVPDRTDANSSVLPYIEQMMLLEYVERAEQCILPLWPVTPMAVTDEDSRVAHLCFLLPRSVAWREAHVFAPIKMLRLPRSAMSSPRPRGLFYC